MTLAGSRGLNLGNMVMLSHNTTGTSSAADVAAISAASKSSERPTEAVRRTSSASSAGGSRRGTAGSEREGGRRPSASSGRKSRKISVGLLGNITPEDLQTLLQQPRNRLMIEESHTLQEGTEMGHYMMQKGPDVESESAHRVASRAPAGQLRLRSFARRMAQTAFGLWIHALAEEKRAQEVALQQTRAQVQRRISGSLALEGSSGSQSRRSSSGKIISQAGHVSKGIDMTQLQEAASKVAIHRDEKLPEKAVLMQGSFATAMASQHGRGILMAAVEKTMTGQRYPVNVPKEKEKPVHRNEDSPKDGEAKVCQKKLRRAPARSPDQSPRGPRERMSYDPLHPGRRREQRRERLLEDSMYVEDQMHKLRKGKVLLKDALANTSAPDLFENACLYTPYAQQIRRRKDLQSSKELGDVSLPNLQQRTEDSQNTATRNRLQNSRANLYEVKKDEKKKGAENPTNIAMQVRDLQHMMAKSQNELQNPKEANARKGENSLKLRRG